MKPYKLTDEYPESLQPVRGLRKGGPGKQIVHFPSLKNEGVVVCESKLEADFCLWMEYSEKVISYQPQPERFEFVMDGGVYSYTPDFLANLFTGQKAYWEVKHESIKSDHDYLEKFSMARQHVASRGCKLELATSAAIQKKPQIDTLRMLYARAHVTQDSARNYLADCLAKIGGTSTWGTLCALEVAPSLSALATMLFRHDVDVDLGTRFGRNTRIALKERSVYE